MGNETKILYLLCGLAFVAILAIALSPLWDRSKDYRACEQIYQSLEKNQSLLQLSEAINDRS